MDEAHNLDDKVRSATTERFGQGMLFGMIKSAFYELQMCIRDSMYAAEIVLDLKSKYPHITLESAIPCETQAIKWSVASRERYYNLSLIHI